MYRVKVDDLYVAVRSLLGARLASPATRQQALQVLAAIEEEALVKFILSNDDIHRETSNRAA